MINYYIFGAHSRGRTVKEYLRVLKSNMRLLAYLYDNDEENPAEADGVPVIKVSGANEIIGMNSPGQDPSQSRLDIDCPVYIGTRGVSHPHIIEVLTRQGFTDIRPVTVDLDILMRNAYVEKIFKEKRLSFRKIQVQSIGKESGNESNALPSWKETAPNVISKTDDNAESRTKNTCCIYVAKSANDKKLSAEWVLDEQEKILQVGCALTEEKVAGAAYFDDQGENISDCNKQFCELTGLYWIWKHATQDVVGLVHYRRHFLLPEGWERYFAAATISPDLKSLGVVVSADEASGTSISYNDKADVILPVPLYVAPSLAGNFRDRHVPAIWETMMEALAEGDVEEAKRAEAFFETNGLYCPCNMLIARREILSRLCGWLFPILFKVETRIGTLADPYQNRYPGFLSERLITFWFYEHREAYRIWFADKNFLQ